MSNFNDEEYGDMPPAYGTGSQRSARNNTKSSEKTDSNDDTETKSSDDKKSGTGECKIWLQVLPSKGGLLLAVLLAEIMTEGMNPEQENILGNFISAVGSLISYKATRDEIDFP